MKSKHSFLFLIISILFLTSLSSCQKDPPIPCVCDIKTDLIAITKEFSLSETVWKGALFEKPSKKTDLILTFTDSKNGTYSIGGAYAGEFVYDMRISKKTIWFRSSPKSKTNYFLDGLWWIKISGEKNIDFVKNIEQDDEIMIRLEKKL